MRGLDHLRHDALMHLSRRFGQGWAKPDRISVNLTLRCNLSCSMCTTCYDAPELSLDEVRSIIDQTAEWGVEVFNPLGGEPFMRGDIEEILSYAVLQGFYVTLTTNGTLITERRARSVAGIPSDRLHFNISLDGDAESNDAVRGEGSYERAIQGYRRLREADSSAGNAKRKILANTILHAGNLDRFEEILEEQEGLGFDGVQILNLFRAGPETPEAGRELWFGMEHYGKLGKLCERLAAKAAGQPHAGYRIQNSPEEILKIPRYYQEDLKPLEAPCWAGWKELYINADGKAIMCDGKLDFLAGAFGDTRKQSLRELWSSPALEARRAVVKGCQTPCVQNCYLRPDSDSALRLASEAGGLALERAASRLRRLQPIWRRHPDAVLRLELSDTSPSDLEGEAHQRARWKALTRKCLSRPTAENWTSMRDSGELDFGRGFMGFGLLREVLSDLLSSRLHFGVLCLSWRGDPLLHPEIDAILDYVLERGAKGLFGRLRIETTGLFLREAVATRAGTDFPQDWVLDLDAGDAAGLGRLLTHRGRQTRIVLRRRALAGWDGTHDVLRFPNFSPVAGRYPSPAHGDAIWFSRTDHEGFIGNSAARGELRRIAEALGLPVELGEENEPKRCRAPNRSPVVSWDGKLALCTRDVQLQNIAGEVTSQRFPELWRSLGPIRRECEGHGRPRRDFCRDCGFVWSPNAP
jgi:MoaA/NifB/PqqE/SkfB family radical SAM enzyme